MGSSSFWLVNKTFMDSLVIIMDSLSSFAELANTSIVQKSSRLTCCPWWVHSPVVKLHPQQYCGFLLYTRWWGHTLLRVISSGTLNQRSALEHLAFIFVVSIDRVLLSPKHSFELFLCFKFLLGSAICLLCWIQFPAENASGLLLWVMLLLVLTWSCLCRSQSPESNNGRPR